MVSETFSGLVFHTRRGSRYFYDDNTGLVFVCPDVMYEILLRFQEETEESLVVTLSGRYPPGDVSAYYRYVYRWATQHGAFFLSQRSARSSLAVTPQQIQDYLLRNGFRQLILNVTEDCNLRCRYCVFSECYPTTRTYSPAQMEFDVAHRAVDYYLEMLAHVQRRNPYRTGVITFYGGEPLLRFKLIHEIIDYVKATFLSEVLFTMTTNGILLSGLVADYLVANNVAISISLDGPQQEHDRLRVAAGGHGSFATVFRNTRRLCEHHPDYKAGLILSCYDCGTDLHAVRRFFDEHNGQLPSLGRVTLVSPHFTTYYDRYTQQDWQRMSEQLTQLRERYFEDVACQGTRQIGYLEWLIGPECRLVLLRSMSGEIGLPFLPYTSTCVPGDKIAVDPDGTFHLCEKMNQSFPIGHVGQGLDMDRIVSIVKAYNERILTKCSSCPITRLCGICYSLVAADGRFEKNPPDFCQRAQEVMRQRLAYTYSILEENPRAYEDLVVRYYEHFAEPGNIDF